MLYLDLAKNREDFILENELKYPYFIQKILRFFRKEIGQLFCYDIEGKKVVVISKWNKKVSKKLDKILKIDVTKTVCICENLMNNQTFMNYINEKRLNIVDGKWLFRFLICKISELICRKNNFSPEEQEISILVQDPDFLILDTIKKFGINYKNVSVLTNKMRKFDKLSKEVYDEYGLTLNITNNFKNACSKSKIIFNFDFSEKELNKIRFLPDATIINLEQKLEVRQSNFKGKCYDSYTINIPIKYCKIYKRLKNFNPSILYESFIYKKTANENIWNEIEKDGVNIISLDFTK